MCNVGCNLKTKKNTTQPTNTEGKLQQKQFS